MRWTRCLQRSLILGAASLLLCYSLFVLHQAGVNNTEKLYEEYYADGYNSVESWPEDNWRNLTEAQIVKLSNLGRRLMFPEDVPAPAIIARDTDLPKEYLILVWKYGPTMERRHLKHFTNELFSPWENCSVKNCRLSYDSADAEKAQAILFHLHRIKGVDDLPQSVSPNAREKQRWIFLTDESPLHTFLGGKQQIANYNGLFNWSMTYRMDSDVPVPYGRTVLQKQDDATSATHVTRTFENPLPRKTKLVAIMGSNCDKGNRRWEYVRQLQEALGGRLDIYGHCLRGDTVACPGHFARDCAPLGAYKFYLAFENSNCEEYLTEKPFWHGYGKLAVPVVLGASRANCRKLLPPKSFIHVADFANPRSLADYLLYLDTNDAEYLEYHSWRGFFRVLNEHGYFQSPSFHYCRLCEALNYNDPSAKVYERLEEFWNPKTDCWSSGWSS